MPAIDSHPDDALAVVVRYIIRVDAKGNRRAERILAPVRAPERQPGSPNRKPQHASKPRSEPPRSRLELA